MSSDRGGSPRVKKFIPDRGGALSELTTCLWFDSEGEEAATFYVDIFPNSNVQGVTPYVGGDRDGQAMTVDFVLNGQKFVALNGGPQFRFTEAISFQIPCADQDEVDRYWDTLVEGGEESQCGWLKDPFGLSWQVVPTRPHRAAVQPRARGGRPGRPGPVRDAEDRSRRPGGRRGGEAAGLTARQGERCGWVDQAGSFTVRSRQFE